MEDLKEVVSKFIKMQNPNLGAALMAEAIVGGEDDLKRRSREPSLSSEEEEKESRVGGVETIKVLHNYCQEIQTAELLTTELTANKVSIKITG